MMMRQQCAICRRDGHLLADLEMESKGVVSPITYRGRCLYSNVTGAIHEDSWA